MSNICKLRKSGPIIVYGSGLGSFKISCKHCDSRNIFSVSIGGEKRVVDYFCEEHSPSVDYVGNITNGSNVMVQRM